MGQALSYKWLREFGPVRSAERRNQQRFEKQLKAIADGMKCDEKKTFSDYWDALVSYGGRGSSGDELFYASGDSTLTSRGSFTFEKKCCKKSFGRKSSSIDCFDIYITGEVQHNWRDRYDWNAGAGAYVPGFGIIPDSAIARLETEGSAASFNMTSSWSQSLSGYMTNCPFTYSKWTWIGP